MITRTAIDAQALRDVLDEPKHRYRRSHSELTKMLEREGCLLFTDPSDQKELITAIKQQGSEVRSMWLETLKRLHQQGRFIAMTPSAGRPTSVLCREEPLPRAAAAALDLIVVSNKAAERPEFEATGYFQREGEPELVILDALKECTTLRTVESMREQGNYPKGTPRSTIWNDLFKPMARLSNEVTILDRYLLQGALTGRRSAHVTWLLRQFANDMPPEGRIRFLAEYPEGISEQAVTTSLSRLVGSTPLDVQVWLSPWTGDSQTDPRGPHNRHARFSCGPALALHEGFDRLRTETVRGADGFTWQFFRAGGAVTHLADVERYVLAHKSKFEWLHLAR